MTDDSRSIELEVEVPGTPEEVWAAVATGPGIGSWFVPTTVEEREGGETVSQFGPGDSMSVRGRCGSGTRRTGSSSTGPTKVWVWPSSG